ncbi:helix-turn-helix domain-containing protein [Streptomyces sp. NPDC058045]|uniref:AraC-like ligand-binding domain-containing protein n=1 Tax=Streptomyces sp. NPDC058045 TaxID=3346311 RepID=UPI0036ED3581
MSITDIGNSRPAPGGLEAFIAASSEAFVPLEASALCTEDEFGGVIEPWRLGETVISRIIAAPVRMRRTARMIARCDPEQLKVALQLRGRCRITQGRNETVVLPGHLAFYDTSRPYELVHDEAFENLVVMVPRSWVHLSGDGLRSVTAGSHLAATGASGVASVFVQSLVAELSSGRLAGNAQLADALVGIINAALAEHLCPEEPTHPATLRHEQLRAVQESVESRLGDVFLTVPRIAAEHRISVRQLQKLFEHEHTTVTEWIRQRRLVRIRHDLADPKLASLPISRIAQRWGITDAGYFSKLFKARYGITPREYRAGRLGPTD